MEKQLTDEEALQRFLLDIDCLDELLPWTGKFNIFDVLKISRTEIRHSNTLSWLLDPTENHGLGDAYLTVKQTKGLSRGNLQLKQLGQFPIHYYRNKETGLDDYNQ